MKPSLARLFFLPCIMATGLRSPAANADDSSAPDGSYTVSAAYEFYGRSPYPINSRGARLGYFFNNQQELNLTYVESNHDVLLAQYKYQECALIFSLWQSSNLYWGGGLGVRSVKIASDVFLENNGTIPQQQNKQKVDEDFQMLTGNLVFGIEYPIFDNFVIGTELFGLSTPLHWLKKSTNYPENALETEEDPKTFPYIRDGLRTNYHLLRSFIKFRL